MAVSYSFNDQELPDQAPWASKKVCFISALQSISYAGSSQVMGASRGSTACKRVQRRTLNWTQPCRNPEPATRHWWAHSKGVFLRTDQTSQHIALSLNFCQFQETSILDCNDVLEWSCHFFCVCFQVTYCKRQILSIRNWFKMGFHQCWKSITPQNL